MKISVKKVNFDQELLLSCKYEEFRSNKKKIFQVNENFNQM